MRVFNKIGEGVTLGQKEKKKVREDRISFWIDKWLSNGPLAVLNSLISYPHLKIKDVGLIAIGMCSFFKA